MSLIFLDFVGFSPLKNCIFTHRMFWSRDFWLPVRDNAIYYWRKMTKISEYQRHPYILSKRPNVVLISLPANIFPSYNVSHTFPHFSQMLEKLNFSLTTMHFQCQNFLILSHLSESFDVPAGCLCSDIFYFFGQPLFNLSYSKKCHLYNSEIHANHFIFFL